MSNEISDGQVALLSKPVDDFELSVRAHNALRFIGIWHLWQLVEKTEADLLSSSVQARNQIMQKCLSEIKEFLAELGLSLGMDLNTVKHRLAQPSASDATEASATDTPA